MNANATSKVANSGIAGPARSLRVLLVEDSQADAVLLARALERGGFAITWERVDTAVGMEQGLRKHGWDLILCDHAMPAFSAPEALELLKKHSIDLPFIIVSGYIEEQTAVAAMQAGAHDYIMKDRLARLVPAVQRELREAAVRRARQESEENLRRAHEELELRVEQRTAALKAANLQLENVIEERKRLEYELLEIAENERRRIGFDLHDDLGQKLTGVSMMIIALEQRLATEHHSCLPDARKIHQLMDEIIHHTHDLAHQFGSLDVRGDDLAVVLKGLCENVKRMFGIPCAFSVKGSIQEVSQNTTVQLYKIAQEAVSNGIKHGKATYVSVSVVRHNDHLQLTIKNNGLPFSPPTTGKDRMGLRIMNYRANTIGANLEIRPHEKAGTLVICTVPLMSFAKITLQGHARAGKAPHHPTENLHAQAAA